MLQNHAAHDKYHQQCRAVQTARHMYKFYLQRSNIIWYGNFYETPSYAPLLISGLRSTADSHSVGQEIPCLYKTWRYTCSQAGPYTQSLECSPYKPHFNIIPPMCNSQSSFSSWDFCDKYSACIDNFYLYTVHSDIHTVHSPTDAHLLKLWLQFTLKLGGSCMFWSTTIIRELAIEPG